MAIVNYINANPRSKTMRYYLPVNTVTSDISNNTSIYNPDTSKDNVK